MSTTVLVTGGYGFIGSNFIRLLHRTRPDMTIVNLDAVTYAGNPDNIADIDNTNRITSIRGDITDKALVRKLFDTWKFDRVVHFAAESHVDRSITGPESFIHTNVLGTQILLDVAWNAWKDNPGRGRFLHVSTDEVYGTLGTEGYFTESTPLAPNSPYSASKAGSDLVVRSYFHTFGMPVLTTRCSNNYGPFQFPEKLIPLMITRALANEPLPVYGDGMNVRDWLYVEDHCSACLAVLESGQPGEVYNIGGNNEWHNIDIVKTILALLGKPESLISFVKDRPGHDRRYAIDAARIQRELGWSPSVDFSSGIEKTVTWYLDNTAWWRALQERAALAR